MIRPISILIIACLGTASLVSCSAFNRDQVAKQTPLHQICSQLRHQLIFRNNTPSTNPNPNMMQNTPTQQARALNEYEHYHCDEVATSPTGNGA